MSLTTMTLANLRAESCCECLDTTKEVVSRDGETGDFSEKASANIGMLPRLRD